MTTLTKDDWNEIDPAELDDDLQDQYNEYVKARRTAGALKAAFEKSMAIAAQVPVGKKMVFGYNFGKLSAAIVEDERKPSKPQQPKLSLAEFMARQQANGRAV